MTQTLGMDDDTENLIRVLLAEDEESFIEALEIGLSREGFSLTIARDGVSALELFRSGTFELVLLDVMSVSYTHLDVYKRQDVLCEPRPKGKDAPDADDRRGNSGEYLEK